MGVVFLLVLYIVSDRADPASECTAQQKGPAFEQQLPAPQRQTPREVDFTLDYKTRASPREGEDFFPFPRLPSLHSGPLLCLAGAG